MALNEQARAALQTATAPAKLSLADGAQQLDCELSAIDSLACAVTRFTLGTTALAGATPERLKRLGEQLAERLTYLLEPISPIEFDRDGCVLQLRSNPPNRDEESTSYYELVARRGGELSLCRYAKKPGDVREAIAMHFTREVFLRLVGDFSAAV